MYYYRPSHPRASPGGFVSAEDLADLPVEVEQAINAPILSGRFYENTKATDGTDIGSRAKHREYMKASGLTVASDYTQTWEKRAEQREAVRRGERGALPSKTRRDVIARALYRLDKP